MLFSIAFTVSSSTASFIGTRAVGHHASQRATSTVHPVFGADFLRCYTTFSRKQRRLADDLSSSTIFSIDGNFCHVFHDVIVVFPAIRVRIRAQQRDDITQRKRRRRRYQPQRRRRWWRRLLGISAQQDELQRRRSGDDGEILRGKSLSFLHGASGDGGALQRLRGQDSSLVPK